MNENIIKEKLKKNPYIKKQILRMDDINEINIQYIEHFIEIIESNPEELRLVHISYSDYHSFLKLYKAILIITNQEEKDISFETLSLEKKEEFLKNNNINYIKEKNSITVEVKDFKTTKLIGAKSWCISSSKSSWNDYNQDGTFIIVYEDTNFYGISVKNKIIRAYDKRNSSVDLNTIKKKMAKKYSEEIGTWQKEFYKEKIIHSIITAIILYFAISFFYGTIISLENVGIGNASARAVAFITLFISGILIFIVNKKTIGIIFLIISLMWGIDPSINVNIFEYTLPIIQKVGDFIIAVLNKGLS